MQKLILPINKARMTASWKTDAYKSRFGFVHYGADLVSTSGSTQLYSSGNGTVLSAGSDSVLGNFVVIKYTDAYNRVTQKSCDVVCRMWHMASVSVKEGQTLTKNTVLGYYGATGQFVTGAHLHIEMDTDTAYPMYTPSLSGKTSNFYGSNYGANDKSMRNPLEWLHCKSSAPDYQTWTTDSNSYIRAEDKTIDTIIVL